MNFDKDNIPVAVMKKLTDKILGDENFDPDKIKYTSTAAEGKILFTSLDLMHQHRFIV